jgi:hypothetical protein
MNRIEPNHNEQQKRVSKRSSRQRRRDLLFKTSTSFIGPVIFRSILFNTFIFQPINCFFNPITVVEKYSCLSMETLKLQKIGRRRVVFFTLEAERRDHDGRPPCHTIMPPAKTKQEKKREKAAADRKRAELAKEASALIVASVRNAKGAAGSPKKPRPSSARMSVGVEARFGPD